MSLCSNKCSFFNSDGGYFFPLPIYFICLLLHSNHAAIYHIINNTKVLVVPSTFFKKSINKRNALNILVLFFDNRSLSHNDIFLLSLWNLFSWGILLAFSLSCVSWSHHSFFTWLQPLWIYFATGTVWRTKYLGEGMKDSRCEINL